MREPLNNGSPSHYERPNQPWSCGLSGEGGACPAGPTAGGRCPALAVCMPVRDGDRWRCNRSPLRGGPCDDGPAPNGECSHVHRCDPVPSLRSKRGQFLVACVFATAGALLIVVQTKYRDNFISPGPLARQHAQLASSDGGVQQCSACHAAANEGPTGWLGSLALGHGDAPSQSERCMECHSKDFSRQLARSPHNLPAETLTTITGARGGGNPHNLLLRAVNTVFVGRPTEPACAACHHEHQGADHNLATINNAGCQACHRQRYQSFADDHPGFGAWPYERRTRIIFDHLAHQAKQFAEKKQRFDCRTCHVEDATHSVQLLTSYDRACAACHDEKIRTSIGQGVPMLALPTLDVNAFRRAGLDVGPWPAAATGDFDGRMPPAMKILLAGDPHTAKALAKLGANFEFVDLEADNVDQLQAGAVVVEGIKKLFADLSQQGPDAMRARLRTALGRDVTNAELQRMFAGLSMDTIRAATKSWFPNADIGNTNWASTPAVLNLEHKTLNSELSYAQSGAWSRDDTTFTIRYQLAAHADPVFASWLSVVVHTPELDDRPLLSGGAKELMKPTTPGQCASCHSVEQTSVGALTMNWLPLERTNDRRTFTKFSHNPHLTLPQLADCTACHALDPQADTTASYADHDPHRFVSEFQPMAKQKCAECHTATAAGDSCQSCHRYHVDGVEDWRLPQAPSAVDGMAAQLGTELK